MSNTQKQPALAGQVEPSVGPRLTQWMPGHINPKREGVYMQRCGFGVSDGYQYWDGTCWYSWCETPDLALEDYRKGLRVQSRDKWRGLATRPNVLVTGRPR